MTAVLCWVPRVVCSVIGVTSSLGRAPPAGRLVYGRSSIEAPGAVAPKTTTEDRPTGPAGAGPLPTWDRAGLSLVCGGLWAHRGSSPGRSPGQLTAGSRDAR